jgi:hypothetical protein
MKTAYSIVVAIAVLFACFFTGVGAYQLFGNTQLRTKLVNLFTSSLGSIRRYTVDLFQKKPATAAAEPIGEEIPVSA